MENRTVEPTNGTDYQLRQPDDALTLRDRLRIYDALIVREMMMRYGRGNVGFLWVLLEPMLLTVGVLFLWTMIKGDTDKGVPVVALVLTGYMMLTLWRHLTGASVFMFRRNSSLLYHRNITLFQVFLSRMMLEFISTTAALIVVTSVLLGLELSEPISDVGLMLTAWFLMFFFGLSSALVICSITEISEVWEKFIQPFQYLMIPLSGTFFLVDWFPTDIQWYLLLNPMVHCNEIFRAGYIGESVIFHYTIWYPLAYTAVVFLVGLLLLEYTRKNVHLD